MDLLSLAATQSEQYPPIHPPVPPYHQQCPLGASDSPNHPVYHHHRSSSLQHLNPADTSMDAVSPTTGPHVSSASGSHCGSASPRETQHVAPKNVSFELYFPKSPNLRPRLPMRVSIYPHDTTDSIVTTVKNFYGLYQGPNNALSISFQDVDGNVLIARYENFYHNMVVTVRVTEEPRIEPSDLGFPSPAPVGAQPYLKNDSHHQTLPSSTVVSGLEPGVHRRRSPSPGRGRRSTSTSTNGKNGRSRSAKNRGHGGPEENGYSSDASVPGKAKEHIGNTEISLDNIVEGNRRKRAKFESSELPLFAPPQMPASTSNPSVSPARRMEQPYRPAPPYIPQGQHPFSNPPPLGSPPNFNNGFAHPSGYITPADRRARGSIGYPNGSGGILPTPDPTVHSQVSEEDKDVALQLMRLGSHGRTSTSTVDDTFSGRADAASSTGATSDADSEDDDELPAARRQKVDASGPSRKVFQTTESHFVPPHNNSLAPLLDASSHDGAFTNGASKHSKPAAKPKPTKPRAQSVSKPKTSKPKTGRPAGAAKAKKASISSVGPMSPASAGAPRKQSIASVANSSLQPGEEETPDLSTKPRCQRCRKSKKGCDRQRPCGRCRDAGLGADQCISEDEGNGRKGRYGRHMGVPIKKEDVPGHQPALLPAAPIQAAPMSTTAIPPPAIPTDKSKKRKR